MAYKGVLQEEHECAVKVFVSCECWPFKWLKYLHALDTTCKSAFILKVTALLNGNLHFDSIRLNSSFDSSTYEICTMSSLYSHLHIRTPKEDESVNCERICIWSALHCTALICSALFWVTALITITLNTGIWGRSRDFSSYLARSCSADSQSATAWGHKFMSPGFYLLEGRCQILCDCQSRISRLRALPICLLLRSLWTLIFWVSLPDEQSALIVTYGVASTIYDSSDTKLLCITLLKCVH